MANTDLRTRLFTWLNGELVGEDDAGNKYYRSKGGSRGQRRERRWVVYNGEVEATRIPPEWYGWMHHTFAEPPTKMAMTRRPWQRPHRPNLTGTAEAYRPPGHEYKGGQRDRATGDYEPWMPS